MLYDYSRLQSEIRSDAPAITMGSKTLTYGDLEKQSNQLAHVLLEKGLKPGDRVCLFAEKNPDTIVAMLGVMKAGGVYVPLDINSPAERISRMVLSSFPAFILTDKKAEAAFQELRNTDSYIPGIPVIWWSDSENSFKVNTAFSKSDVIHAENIPYAVVRNPETAAHILFTSGSTGLPKGVVIKHSNVTAFVAWAVDYFDMKPGERNSGHSPLHFDLSTYDIYGTFAAGGHLFPVPVDMSVHPVKLVEFIRDNRLTQWFSVPSALNYLARFKAVPESGFPDLKRLIWCGEVFPLSGLQYWVKSLNDVQFTNLYGPTEATIASSFFTLSDFPEKNIPIGKACSNEGLLILDDDMKPVRNGEKGNLYISGAGLSPGYWVSPNPNVDHQLPPSPFVFFENESGEQERIYKTGDLASIGEDGLVYFHGRADYQIKSRGYRIELGEIEAALSKSDILREFAVVPVEKGGFEGTSIGCAFVLAEDVSGNGRPEPRIKKTLQELVPPYMIPHFWKAYDKLPRNANGKIDRRKLSDHFEQ
ncbi:MAG: amino acid adenylation domain-containing protein [Balneolia bacterium]|nr:amino acid adenylation domain-containing protein [Balneolia bacterium]